MRHDGPKICYGPQRLADGVFLRSTDLLFRTTIEEQEPHCFLLNGIPALFPVHNQSSALPFDPFAAAFYCLSRYEEYLPFFSDAHGRFPASASIAFREHFLDKAVVDRWALMLADIVGKHYPSMRFPARQFDVENTVDIDAAYCYKHKGLFRTSVGAVRDLLSNSQPGKVRQRLRVILGKATDPFDTFDYIIETVQHHSGHKLTFFPLMADYNVFDKPIDYQNVEFRELLQHLGDNAQMGLHSSYASFDKPHLVAMESERLATLLHRPTARNRNHFLRLSLPKSYNVLIENGITHDYTMGFADEPGFRSGTATPYPFFDLESDCETSLTIHPFTVMDSTLHYYKKMSLESSMTTYEHFIDEVRDVGGTLSLLWHNQSLCEDFGWQGWRGVFEHTLEYADRTCPLP